MAETAKTLDTIDLLYRAALEPELWREALQAFAHATGGMGTAMIPITPLRTDGLVVSPALEEANVEYEREWWRYDTRVLRIYSRKLSDGVCCEAELFTDEELAKDPLRQEFLRSYGIGAFAAQLVKPAPDFVVAFSVQRALERGHFERHELDRLELLGKHAARALLISTHLAQAGKLAESFVGTLAHLDCGAFLVDHEARVIHANEAAEPLLGDGLCLAQGQLRAQAQDHQAILARLMRSAFGPNADASELETIALPRPSGSRPLLVQAIPVSPASMPPILPGGAAALVIVVDPERHEHRSPLKALCLLGLTPAEARLAALIGAGFSRAEAAEALGIAASTASDTLKQVYAKLDISRQSELVRLIDRLSVLACRRGDERPGD